MTEPMDEQTRKGFIRFLAKELQSHWRHLAAYHAVFNLLKQGGVKGIDGLLEHVRNSPELRRKYDEYWAGFDELIPSEAETVMSPELYAFAKKMAESKEPD